MAEVTSQRDFTATERRVGADQMDEGGEVRPSVGRDQSILSEMIQLKSPISRRNETDPDTYWMAAYGYKLVVPLQAAKASYVIVLAFGLGVRRWP